MSFETRTTRAARAMPIRLMSSMWRQRARTPTCPESPRLDGKLALVTGGNAGIGLEVSRGLAQHGAEVMVAARSAATAESACKTIASETGATLSHVPLDLSDLRSVVLATDRILELAKGRPIDVLVANAGIWPKAYARSAQGHEIAFATNTLGHHVLVRRLLDRGQLAKNARIVVVTGDIYVRASECTSDFRYEGTSGGGLAYSRSKLGNLWFAGELQRRHPDLEVCAVHPGVIASGLGGEVTGFARTMQGLVMLDVTAGAQTPLWCATQRGVERGAYYHNAMGKVVLPDGDPAASAKHAAELWARLETLSVDFR